MKWKLVVTAYVNDDYIECQFAVLKEISLKTINKILSLRDRLNELGVDGFVLENCFDIDFYQTVVELPGDYEYGDSVNFFTKDLDLSKLTAVEDNVGHIKLTVDKYNVHINGCGRYGGNIYDTSIRYNDLIELKKRLTNINNS